MNAIRASGFIVGLFFMGIAGIPIFLVVLSKMVRNKGITFVVLGIILTISSLIAFLGN